MYKAFIFLLLMICTVAYGELKYEQNVTLTSFISRQDAKNKAERFCTVAKNDKNIKVIDVQYKTRKIPKGIIIYEAIITCYVSEVDKDLRRIHEKILYEIKGNCYGNE